MSAFVVVDSSVAFKWFAPAAEEGLEPARALLGEHRAETITLAAPTLLRLEVLNGFWKRSATSADLTMIAATLDDFGLAWFDLTVELSSHAAHVAAEHRLTVYDSVFVALALQLDCELITDDRGIIRSEACRLLSLGG